MFLELLMQHKCLCTNCLCTKCLCSIIEFSCPLDININRKVNEKLENYGPLVRNLQIIYPEHKFQVAPIAIGAIGYVPKSLIKYLKMIGFNENESKVLISKL